MLWSTGAEKYLGFTADQVLGRHCLTGIRCGRCLGSCGLMSVGTISGVSVLLHRADGQERSFRKYAQSFVGEDGRFLGGIEVLLPEEHQALRSEPAEEEVNFHGIVTRDPGMLQAIQVIRNVAETDATVLVRGESGTGKELVARAIHEESHRRDRTFLAVNCASFTPSLLESELFGHVKGSFTGATADRAGIFVQANRGTLFLDEVAEIPLELQSKLLRVLQERVVVPVGSNRPQAVDVRVVAATHHSLRDAVKAGKFREDLMYRLRVVPVFLPPLRERPRDIELLLQHFLQKGNQRGPREVKGILPEVMRLLLDHDWPGNVRELQNVVEYAFAVGRGPTLGLQDLPPEFREPALPSSTLDGGDELQRVRQALAAARGNLGRAAELAGMSRTSFWRARKKYGI
ncbi:MAG TPA: sigma 54-interacting transcriptional regulator [Myxococcota bacterium]|nr:sigma 54-interacting transcriptional regulator [Myxococcota bacterium]